MHLIIVYYSILCCEDGQYLLSFFFLIKCEMIMSRICEVTGKKPMAGNNVSHAKNRTRRRFLPNLQIHRFWLEAQKRWISLRVSRKGLRIIEKKGIEAVLKEINKI